MLSFILPTTLFAQDPSNCEDAIEFTESITLPLAPGGNWYKLISPIDGYIHLTANEHFISFVYPNCQTDKVDDYLSGKDQRIKCQKGQVFLFKCQNYNNDALELSIDFRSIVGGEFCDLAIPVDAGENITNSTHTSTYYTFTPETNGQISIVSDPNMTFYLKSSCNGNDEYVSPSRNIKYDVFAGESIYLEANPNSITTDFEWKLIFHDQENLEPSCLNAIAVQHGETVDFPRDQTAQYYSISLEEDKLLTIDAEGQSHLNIQVKESCTNSGYFNSLPFEKNLSKGNYLIFLGLENGTSIEEDFPITFNLSEPMEKEIGSCSNPLPLKIGANEVPKDIWEVYYTFTPETDGILHFNPEQVNWIIFGKDCKGHKTHTTHDILLKAGDQYIFNPGFINRVESFDITFESKQNLPTHCANAQVLPIDSLTINGNEITPEFYRFEATSDGVLVFHNAADIRIEVGTCDEFNFSTPRFAVKKGEQIDFKFYKSLQKNKKIFIEYRPIEEGDLCENAQPYHLGENVVGNEQYWRFTAPQDDFYQFSATLAKPSNGINTMQTYFYLDCFNEQPSYRQNNNFTRSVELLGEYDISSSDIFFLRKGEEIIAYSDQLHRQDTIKISSTIAETKETCATAMEFELGDTLALLENNWRANYFKYTAAFSGLLNLEFIGSSKNIGLHVKNSCDATYQTGSYMYSDSPFYVEQGKTYYFEGKRYLNNINQKIRFTKGDENHGSCTQSLPLIPQIYELTEHTVFFEYLAPANGIISIGNCNLSRDNKLSIYTFTGSCELLINGRSASSITTCAYGNTEHYSVTAGETYYFKVKNHDKNAIGKIQVEIELENQPLKGIISVNGTPQFGEAITALVDEINVTDYTGEWYKFDTPTGITTNTLTLDESLLYANLKYVVTSSEKDGVIASKASYAKIFEQNKPNIPEAEKIDANHITLKEQPFMEYRIEGEGWQRSTEFPDLAEGETYNFYQRVYASAVSKRSDASEALAVVTRPLGADKPQIALLAYPNPTTNILNIEVANPSSVQLISMAGTVLIEQFVDAEGKINVSHLAPGLYIIRALDGENEFTGRIVIE
ncbi:hypothetical protein PEPS_33760 (plasmid) [Persicobacter psychrovividus]|uniref:Secretion system C-terminal sorting domain-containing protein n=2 Tax=Persicobacter psychrovividus TaxID=387638 RepID=A0ABM7VJD2_9BACT|nr:hypothetical protein PEPS_33760 [Persicobacter psychrovividus]